MTADINFADETFLLTQRTMAKLFGVSISSVLRRLKNIYESQELILEATVLKNEIVQMKGRCQVTHEVEVYNWDAIVLRHQNGYKH